jgi:hypothetical protein
MTHARQSIRQAVAAAVGGVATRTRPTQDAELPAVIVYALKESSELAAVRRSLERTLSVIVEIRAASTGAIDDALDALCEAAEAAMDADPTFGRLAVTSFLAATTIGLDGEGDDRQAVATLEYQVIYRTG